MSLKIVVKQDDGKGNLAIYRADGIGAIEWPFKRKCKQHERPTEKQVRSIYNNLRDFLPIEYQDMNGNVLS